MTPLTLRKALVALAAAGAIGLIAVVYFVMLVPARQEKFTRRGFRILSSMEQNIQEKKVSVTKTLDNIYSKSDAYRPPPGDPLSFDASRVPAGFFIEGLTLTGWIPDTVWSQNYYARQFLPTYDDLANSWRIKFFGDHYDDASATEISNMALVYEYDAKAFFKDVIDLRRDFFEEMVVLSGDSVLHQTSPIASSSNFLGITKKIKAQGLLASDFIVRDTLSNSQYYVFYHPFNSSSDIKLVLCGLVSVGKFNQDRYQIDTNYVIWVIFTFLIATCLMPFIKIFTLSKYEHFRHADVVRAGIALIVIVSFLCLAVLFSANIQAENKREIAELDSLDSQLREHFTEERTSILAELQRHETNIANGMYDKWLSDNKTSPLFEKELISDKFNNDNAKHFVKSLLLIDSTGTAWGAWIQHDKGSPDLDLSERQYVKAFAPGRSNILPNYTTDRRAYYLQPIYSWLDQENTLVVSSRATPAVERKVSTVSPSAEKDLRTIAIETKLFSTFKPVLPAELSFCIVNDKGEVLFHSDETRNLRENFLAETEYPPSLVEAIRSQTTTIQDVMYYGKTHKMRASPVEDMPFTLITLYDKGYFLDSLSNQLMFALTMLLALGIVIGVIYGGTYVLTKRLTYLRRYLVNMRWLTQVSTLSTRACWIVCLLLTAALVIPVWAWLSHQKVVLTLSFMLPIFILALGGAAIYKVYRKKYEESEYRKAIRRKYRIFFALCAIISAFMLFGHYGTPDPDFITSIFAWGMLLFVSGAVWSPDILSLRKGNAAMEETLQERATIKKDFFLVDDGSKGTDTKYWLIVVSTALMVGFLSAYPSMTFFISSMRLERELMQKRNSLEIGETAVLRLNWLSTVYGDFVLSRFRSDSLDVFRKGLYMPLRQADNFEIVTMGTEAESRLEVSDPVNVFDEAYLAIINAPNRLSYFDQYESESMHLDKNRGEKQPSTWTWGKTQSAPLAAKYKTGAAVASLSNIAGFEIRPTRGGWLQNLDAGDIIRLVFTCLLLIAVVLGVLFYLYKKILLVDYFNSDSGVRGEIETDKQFILDGAASGCTNVLIISLPGTDVVEFVQSSLKGRFVESETTDVDLTVAGIQHLIFMPKGIELSNGQGNVQIVPAHAPAPVSFKGQQIVSKSEEPAADEVSPVGLEAPAAVSDPQSEPDGNGQLPSPTPTQSNVTVPAQVHLLEEEPKRIIVLPFVELTLNDFKKCQQRLEVLAKAFGEKQTKVFWITSSDPSIQIANLSKKITELEKKLARQKSTDEKDAGLAQELRELSDAHEIFRSVTGDFHRVTYALEDNMRDAALYERPNQEYTSRFIEEEFRFGAYFRKLRSRVVGKAVQSQFFEKKDNGVKNKFVNADELYVLKIQDLAWHYYHTIWTNLSGHEKYVLYDLALDELTNYRNHSVLATLEAKGVVYFSPPENRLKIFNRSFRNFVLTVVDPEEAMALEREINLTSTWQTIRLVMFVVLAAIVVFLFVTDQKGFTRVLGVFSSLTALGPTLVNFLATFRKVKIG